MDPDREEELLLHVAAGLDPLTAIAATGNDEKPAKPRRSGCVVALLAGVALAIVCVWL